MPFVHSTFVSICSQPFPTKLTPEAALYNLTNSTHFLVNGSHAVPAYFLNPPLPSGYGRGSNTTNANVTVAPFTTFPAVSISLSPQQPVEATPVPPQHSESALIPDPPRPAPAAPIAQSSIKKPDETSTAATSNVAAMAAEKTPANAPQQGTSINSQTEPHSLPSDTTKGPGNSPPSPGQGQHNSGQRPANPGGEVSAFHLAAGTDTFTITPKPSSRYVIGSETLTPGGSITVNNVPIFLPTQGSSIVIGASTIPFSPSPPPVNAALASALKIIQNPGDSHSSVITVANTPISYKTSGSALIIDGSSTLTPGGTITINNVPIYLPTSGSSIVIGSSTIPLEPSPVPALPPTTPGPLVIQGQPLTPGGVITVDNTPISLPTSGSALIIGGISTLTPGGTATVNNIPVRLPTSGSFVVIGSSTIPINPSPTPTAPPITPGPLVIHGQTLTPGGVITISNTPISLPTSGSALIIGGSDTIPLGSAQTISIGSRPLEISQAGASAGIIVDGQTLTPGGVITIANTPISLPTSGASVVIGGSYTIPFGAAQTVSVGSQALVISQLGTSSALVIDGQTIAPGSQAVINGHTVSFPIQGTDVVIDASTTAGLGGAILSALGIAPSTTAPAVGAGSTPTGGSNGTTVSPARFTGGSSPLISNMVTWKKWLYRVGVGLGCVWAGGWV